MTAKEYLMQVRVLASKVRSLDEEITALREEQASIRSAWPDGQPHGSGTTDPTGMMATRLADQLLRAETELISLRSQLWAKRMSIIDTISKVTKAEHNRLLYLRYVQCRSWEEIAVEMHYTYRWITSLHGQALQEVEKILHGGNSSY